MTEQTYHPWNDGLPTRPEVDALLKQWPPETIQPGWEVTDAQVREVVGECGAIRYRTIYAAWTRRLRRDHNVIVDRVKERGFRCLTPDEVYGKTHGTLRHAGRAIRNQLKDVSRTKPENELQKTTQEHQGRLLYAQHRELKKARTNALPFVKPAESPRIAPPVT